MIGGFYGALAGGSVGMCVGDALIGVVGVGTGYVAGALGVTFLAAGLYIGARVGYRAAHSMLIENGLRPPPSHSPVRPLQ